MEFLKLIFPKTVYAVEPVNNPALGGNLSGLNGESFLGKFLPALITLFFVVGAVVFVFMLIIGAISWITSGGDKAAHEEAKGRITNALVGIVLLLSVYAIVNFINIFFKINLLQINLSALKIG